MVILQKKRSNKYSILLNEIKANLRQHFDLISPNQSKLLSQYNHWRHHLRWLGCWRTIPSVLDLDSSWSGKPFRTKILGNNRKWMFFPTLPYVVKSLKQILGKIRKWEFHSTLHNLENIGKKSLKVLGKVRQ